MGIIIGVLVGILILSALLLILIVLAQDDGAEGAGMIFGSAASQQYGVRKGNIVTRTTSILAAIFMVNAFVLAFLLKGTDKSDALQTIVDSKTTDEQQNTVQWWDTDTEENATDGTALDDFSSTPASDTAPAVDLSDDKSDTSIQP